MSQDMRCPFCDLSIHDKPARCPVCGEELDFAQLVCSSTVGKLRPGSAWRLLPRDHVVGSDPACDIVIRGVSVSPQSFKLAFRDGLFSLRTLSKDIPEGSKIDPEAIPLGGGLLKLQQIRRIDLGEYRKSAGSFMPGVLSSATLISAASGREEVCGLAADAMLRLTGHEKSLVLGLESAGSTGEVSATILAARSRRGGQIDIRFCPLSSSFLGRLLESDGGVVRLETDRMPSGTLSNSVVKMNLREMIGAPLMDRGGNLAAVMYSDTNRVPDGAPFEFTRPALRILAGVVARRLYSQDSSNCGQHPIERVP